ncbi:Prolactin-3D4 [Cricetulus griseus]|nr:Prolactin-3D4 [Cricetulus griseus]
MEGNNMLREGLKPILNRTHVVVEDNAYPEWSGESDLQSSDEDTLRSAVHSLTTCLKGDMQKIINYLRDMWCRASVRVDCPDRD